MEISVRTKVEIKKCDTGRGYTINIQGMNFDDFLDLGDNLSEEEIEYGKKVYGISYPNDIERYSNDVSYTSFDYQTKEGVLVASTEKDVRNWLELYKDIVYSDNF